MYSFPVVDGIILVIDWFRRDELLIKIPLAVEFGFVIPDVVAFSDVLAIGFLEGDFRCEKSHLRERSKTDKP